MLLTLCISGRPITNYPEKPNRVAALGWQCIDQWGRIETWYKTELHWASCLFSFNDIQTMPLLFFMCSTNAEYPKEIMCSKGANSSPLLNLFVLFIASRLPQLTSLCIRNAGKPTAWKNLKVTSPLLLFFCKWNGEMLAAPNVPFFSVECFIWPGLIWPNDRDSIAFEREIN